MNFKEDENKGAWVLELGTYPGICLGIRTYAESEQTTYVLYIPFVDLALTVYK
jgi:hypothetical protein